jgi:CDP-6-deoxy-D-xylo-4-hexulose-3-dehydrase
VNNKNMSKVINQKVLDFIKTLLHDHEILKFAYNKKKFIPGKSSIYYSGPVWDENEVAAAITTLLTGKWLSSGENVLKFERKLCKTHNQKHGVMVNSGSSANLVMIGALKKVLGWKDNDEIIVSPVGFPTTIAPIVQHGLRPVFIDIEFDTLNFDVNKIEENITERTRAIFISPVLGNPPDFDKIVKICEQNNIALVLDNCDSMGSKWNGKLLSDYAICSSYSFYPAHHITTAEGGAVTSNDYEIIKTARSFAWWGRDCYCVGAANLLPSGTCGNRFDQYLDGYNEIVDHKFIFGNMGYNLKPLDLQGSMGLVQLDKVEMIHEKRRLHKQKLEEIFLRNIDKIFIPKELNKSQPSWFGLPVICNDKKLKQKLVSWLELNKIQTRNYFAGNILLHPAYCHLDDYRKYPNANQVLDRVFWIGVSPLYSEEIFKYIDETLENFDE